MKKNKNQKRMRRPRVSREQVMASLLSLIVFASCACIGLLQVVNLSAAKLDHYENRMQQGDTSKSKFMTNLMNEAEQKVQSNQNDQTTDQADDQTADSADTMAYSTESSDEERDALMDLLNGTGGDTSVNSGNAAVAEDSQSDDNEDSLENTTPKSSRSKPRQVANDTNGEVVYWVPEGEVYHSTANCSTLSRSDTILSGTNPPGNRRRCKVCY